MIAELDASGNLVRRYVHGPGVDEPLVWYDGSGTGTRKWLLADARGSVIGVSDASGDVTVNKYGVYGEPDAANSGRFQYTGQMWLSEANINLYHYKARQYHPGLGRFLQPDPIGYGADMNMYAYVGNDPVNLSDPSGLAATSQKEDKRPWDWKSSVTPPDVIICFTSACQSAIFGRRGGGGGSTAVVCVDGACTPQSGFVRGSSSGTDYGDHIVVTATRSKSYEYWAATGSLFRTNIGGGGGGRVDEFITVSASSPYYQDVTAYRAVDGFEMEAMAASGVRFLPAPNGGPKSFFFSEQNAILYAEAVPASWGPPPFHIIRTEIPGTLNTPSNRVYISDIPGVGGLEILVIPSQYIGQLPPGVVVGAVP